MQVSSAGDPYRTCEWLASWYLSIYPNVLAMHTCMHYWYIHFTTNTMNQGFYHYIPLCLQCVHACIAATFNPNQIAWIKVFVIIFHCVHNAYLHALLILSLYTKYPDSGFLSLYLFVFAMHACMHCWYMQLTTKTLNHGFVIIFCCVCNEYIHALLIDTFPLHQKPWIRVFIIISLRVCNALMHALLLHSTHTK